MVKPNTPSPYDQIEEELFIQYQNLAKSGVDLHEYRLQTLGEIHDSLCSKKSKYYRSVRGAAVAVVPLGGAGHTALTGRSHAQKCVEAYGLAGRMGNKEIVKEVVEEIILSMGISFVAEQAVGSAIPGVSSVLAAVSAPKIMDKVLEAVHERTDSLHIKAIRLVNISSA
ncbi:hypothetical protein BGZ76_008190 [Entomortierella beljakovae]|nr:hypothetical protein BGZ76_008190 [Entomortierella beljakovae]